jgi:endonuclease-3
LFQKYTTAGDFANTPLKQLEKEIHSTGFFRSKAKHIKNACTIIQKEFSGNVPDSMDSLVQLPGVGRKTANVVLGSWFKKPTGVVVDTHVKRISKKLGLTKNEQPEKIEKDLMKTLKKEDWIHFSHMIIWHGRKICTARKPNCPECPILSECPSNTL